jgi:chemotaxis protein methyltransferase CheR
VSDRAVDRAAGLLADRIGLRTDGAGRARVSRALRSAARAAGCAPDALAASLHADERALEDLLERVTVQESSFFRHEAQFAIVAREAAAAGGGVIWSAGCASGEEAWSLAILLAERGLDGWSVLGTDVSRTAIARARAGRYGARTLRGVSAERRRRFLRPVGDGTFEVAPELRARVRYAVHNLVAQPPPPEADGRIVLCRNVLIYLSREHADALLEALRRRMPADGLLLIGAAEALAPDHPSFEPRREDDVYVMRPRPFPAPAEPGARTDPLAHVRRALELGAAGDEEGARRAMRAAREDD